MKKIDCKKDYWVEYIDIKTLNFLFVLTGAKFYMDWLLITNPVSKNPLWRFIMSPMKKSYSATDYKSRYTGCYMFIIVHIIMGLVYLYTGGPFIINLLVNVYPIIVNTYLAIRLRKLIIAKAKNVWYAKLHKLTNERKRYQTLKYNVGDKIFTKKLNMSLHMNDHVNSPDEPYIISKLIYGSDNYYHALTKYSDIQCIYPIDIDEEKTKIYNRENKLNRILDV